MALIMCFVALSIDAVLPALALIGSDLGVSNPNDIQLVITGVFFGVAAGQLVYGPLSDAWGRKPSVYLGFSIFIVGSFVCLFAEDMQGMLLGRFLQGLGAAGPRIVTLAIVRDQYKGAQMARVMSFIMTLFILSPVVAPLIGQVVLMFAGWQEIFILLLVVGLIALIWFAFRLPETLPLDRRTPMRPVVIWNSMKELLAHQASRGFVLGLGLTFGAFLGFLNSVQQIMQDLYQQGAMFPVYFALLAAGIGAASLLNAKLVLWLGMRSLLLGAQLLTVVSSVIAWWFALYLDLNPPFWSMMIYFSLVLFAMGIQFGNLNALAMEPFGHVAGLASSVVGAVSTFVAVGLGLIVGQAFDNTVIPVIMGFAVLGASSGAITFWAFRHRCRAIEQN
ncbi:MAG: multidrug effflux MFS transporter [Neptuniibacter sp.]|nr:multidrug effflux MFS transporter [Neptuniibacter sp.]